MAVSSLAVESTLEELSHGLAHASAAAGFQPNSGADIYKSQQPIDLSDWPRELQADQTLRVSFRPLDRFLLLRISISQLKPANLQIVLETAAGYVANSPWTKELLLRQREVGLRLCRFLGTPHTIVQWSTEPRISFHDFLGPATFRDWEEDLVVQGGTIIRPRILHPGRDLETGTGCYPLLVDLKEGLALGESKELAKSERISDERLLEYQRWLWSDGARGLALPETPDVIVEPGIPSDDPEDRDLVVKNEVFLEVEQGFALLVQEFGSGRRQVVSSARRRA